MLDGAFAPLVALALPGVLVVVASLALFQFQALFRSFVVLASQRHGSAAWELVQPALKRFAAVLEQMLGPATKFAPNTTHVFLAALMLTVVFAGERVRGAVLHKR